MIIQKNKQLISSPADWLRLAGPKKGAAQWKEGRSALECANVWCNALPHVPPEIASLFSRHPDFGDMNYVAAEPEARLPFDQLKGEVRNADVVVDASDQHGPIALTVEAKADETFGETIPDALAAAIERNLVNERSRGVLRIEQLVAALLPARKNGWPSVRTLRYQLLTATAGTLALASRIKADRAVLIIQEFHTDQTTTAKHQSNARDLDAFVHRLSAGACLSCPPDILLGPFIVPGSPLFPTPAKFYVGKVEHIVPVAGLVS